MRQIVFVGYGTYWDQDCRPTRRVTGIFELMCSDRTNFKVWHGLARQESESIIVTSTDRLPEVLADPRMSWSNPGLARDR
jgi:hypothetical protein